MNCHDPFEKQLAETPPRTIPAEWRKEILDECASQLVEAVRPVAWTESGREPLPELAQRDHGGFEPGLGPAVQVSGHSENGFLATLRRWLWPHPTAWAALAAIWIVIIGLSTSAEISWVPSGRPRASTPPSPELLALLREQQALLRSLAQEPPPPPPSAENKPSALWFRGEISREWISHFEPLNCVERRSPTRRPADSYLAHARSKIGAPFQEESVAASV